MSVCSEDENKNLGVVYLVDKAVLLSRMAVFVFCFIAVHWIATLAFSDFIVISLAATKLSVSRCVIVQILFRKS